jgi:methylmalonyl-CoA mutase C-terminal domain/subunit
VTVRDSDQQPRIRVLIGILGLDQHEAGAYAVSRLLRDAGMEVIYVGCFNLPQTIVKSAIEEDVDVVGLSAHSWEYLDYIDELLGLLRSEGADMPVVLGGSIITPGDGALMLQKGVAAVFDSRATTQGMIETIQRIAGRTRAAASER